MLLPTYALTPPDPPASCFRLSVRVRLSQYRRGRERERPAGTNFPQARRHSSRIPRCTYDSWTRGSPYRAPRARSLHRARPRPYVIGGGGAVFDTESAPMATVARASAMKTGLVSRLDESIAEGSYGS